ncbi:23S rRNA (adenine(2503)-C(2))-methyltransferase RlmN [Thermodesulfobacteriota bacterium]
MAPILEKKDIKDLTIEQLVSWLEERDIQAFRAKQILKWIYHRQADAFGVMTDLGKEMRQQLSSHFSINRLEKTRIETSKDGSKKYLFKLEDGTYIESVLIPEKKHDTLCLSSQVGCAQGCRFCLTARGSFARNLSQGEIIAQVRDIANDMEDPSRLTNIVFMGMGEPLANYRNVVNAIQIIADSEIGLGFSSRRITVSTAGLIPRIADLGRDTAANLAISLNAADNTTRNRLMPINRKYPIEKLIDACRSYPLQQRRRITFEYILLKGINDSPQDAKRLAKLLRPVKAKINLIPFNDFEDSEFQRPEDSVIQNFREILHNANYTAIIRHSKGQDISAACGQLSAKILDDG